MKECIAIIFKIWALQYSWVILEDSFKEDEVIKINSSTESN